MIKTINELEQILLSNKQVNNLNFLKNGYDTKNSLLKLEKHLKYLLSPEQELNCIHVAGTSGKGSTCTFLSKILNSQGFSTGGSFSPHVVSITERFTLNSQAIGENELTELANKQLFIPELNQYFHVYQIISGQLSNQLKDLNDYYLSFFEKITCLQFFMFKEKSVDYAILETGIGGRLDASNVPIKNKICVLNSIGLDHVQFLGNTYEKIAYEKAGIIQDFNPTIALYQNRDVNEVFEKQAKLKNTKIDFVKPEIDIFEIKTNKKYTYFKYKNLQGQVLNFKISLLGNYQATNCALALRAVELVSKKDNWKINWNKIKTELASINFAGRFETMNCNKNLIILDGAHNEQKIKSFLDTLFNLYKKRKFTFIIALKEGKDSEKVLSSIIKYKDNLNEIILTGFDSIQDIPLNSINTDMLEKELILLGFKGKITKINGHNKITEMMKNSKSSFVVTGSFYLIGAIKKLLMF